MRLSDSYFFLSKKRNCIDLRHQEAVPAAMSLPRRQTGSQPGVGNTFAQLDHPVSGQFIAEHIHGNLVLLQHAVNTETIRLMQAQAVDVENKEEQDLF